MATPLGVMQAPNDTPLQGANSNGIKHYVLLTRLALGALSTSILCFSCIWSHSRDPDYKSELHLIQNKLVLDIKCKEMFAVEGVESYFCTSSSNKRHCNVCQRLVFIVVLLCAISAAKLHTHFTIIVSLKHGERASKSEIKQSYCVYFKIQNIFF